MTSFSYKSHTTRGELVSDNHSVLVVLGERMARQSRHIEAYRSVVAIYLMMMGVFEYVP